MDILELYQLLTDEEKDKVDLYAAQLLETRRISEPAQSPQE